MTTPPPADRPNSQCDECGGWLLGDGTEDADWNVCECGCDNLRECANGCGEIVLYGGFCSTKCKLEYGLENNDD